MQPFQRFLSNYTLTKYGLLYIVSCMQGINQKKENSVVVERTVYLNKIKPFIGKPIIKVITGMRRTGKSCILRMLIREFRRQGVGDKATLFIDKESLEFDSIKNYNDLNNFVDRVFKGVTGLKYLFIDEIQEIASWEKAVASFQKSGEYDIYITGSNAHLLSSEIATLISGRYIEHQIYALGFEEFLNFRKSGKKNDEEEFKNFLRFGGLPALHHFDFDEETVYQYINSVYNTIILKDIVKRNNIRNLPLLENITRFVFDNIGRVFSAKKISDYLKSQRMRIGVETVQNYLALLCSTYALHKVGRYDIRGKRLLEVHEKYYLGDIGLRHALLGFREADISGILENVVYLELLRRGYRVSIGKFWDREIDFIAEKEGEKIYIQTAYLLSSPEVIEREFSVLKTLPDNYPKFVLSLDTHFGSDMEGIKRINIRDFLLQNCPAV